MRRKDPFKRLLKGTTVDYTSDAVYLQLTKDLIDFNVVQKDSRLFSENEVQAAEAELRLKWQPLDAELLAHVSATKPAEKLKTKILLQRKLKEIHLAEVEKNKPVESLPVTPVSKKTIRDKITERKQARTTREEKRIAAMRTKEMQRKKDKKDKKDKKPK